MVRWQVSGSCSAHISHDLDGMALQLRDEFLDRLRGMADGVDLLHHMQHIAVVAAPVAGVTSDLTGAVFISYASQDAAIAEAVCKALEDAGDYRESLQFYQRGNALKRDESRYRPEIIERNTRRQIEVCTREFFERRSGFGCASRDPIFIVGLPRAGSTLIEQILASHSRVEGTQELADIPRIVQGLQGQDPNLDDPRYPGVLPGMAAEEFQRLGEKYLEDTRVYRTDRGAALPHFIDKMPNNFRHLGLIHLLLPNAKIIDARREPMACCFSNLKQLFAAGQEFTYSVTDIARYYRTYLDLMRHWDAVLPGKVLRVVHETVVDDLSGSVSRCGRRSARPPEPLSGGRLEMCQKKTTMATRTASSGAVSN